MLPLSATSGWLLSSAVTGHRNAQSALKCCRAHRGAIEGYAMRSVLHCCCGTANVVHCSWRSKMMKASAQMPVSSPARCSGVCCCTPSAHTDCVSDICGRSTDMTGELRPAPAHIYLHVGRTRGRPLSRNSSLRISSLSHRFFSCTSPRFPQQLTLPVRDERSQFASALSPDPQCVVPCLAQAKASRASRP